MLWYMCSETVKHNKHSFRRCRTTTIRGHLVNIYKPPTPPPLLTWINIHSVISSLVWQICLSNWKAGKISHILPLSALLSLLLCLSLFNSRVGWHDRINRPLFLHWHIISPWQLHQWVGGSCETGYNPPCHWQRTTIVPVSPAILLFLPLIPSFTVHPHSSSIDNNKLSYAARHKSGNKEGTGQEQEPNRDRGNEIIIIIGNVHVQHQKWITDLVTPDS